MKKIPICPLCYSLLVKYLFASKDRMFHIAGSFGLWQCSLCEQIFLHPQLSEKNLVKYYPSTAYYAYTEMGKYGFLRKLREYMIKRYYHRSFLSLLLSILFHEVPAMPTRVQHGKILDLGCGTGDTLSLLSELGWNVYGMDIDRHALMIAKNRGLKNIKFGTYKKLQNYKDNSFDAIRLYHVIEHLGDPKLCMNLLYKKLKKGGQLIIGTPNVNSIAARIFRSYWYNLDSPRHLFLFSPLLLQRIGGDAKFTIQSTEFCSAGGIVGSIQYYLYDRYHIRVDLIHQLWCIMLFYPIEWFLDKFGMGDIFVMRFSK